jgi:uncharacterized membrane protein
MFIPSILIIIFIIIAIILLIVEIYKCLKDHKEMEKSCKKYENTREGLTSEQA